jgi:3-oxoacyl-[acyl-carrier-protein] synthase-1
LKIEQEIVITPASVVLDGQPIEVAQTGDKMLVELYRRFVGDYPKFFKMDTLCRLGFLAAELLLKDLTTNEALTGLTTNEDQRLTTNDKRPIAIILANRSASIKNDTDYLATISEGNYYPSPALFVYTLPNIVTGEIAIRHHIQGETSFYILDDPEQLEPLIRSTLNPPSSTLNSPPSTLNPPPSTLLAGWCECRTAHDFYAKLQLIWNN